MNGWYMLAVYVGAILISLALCAGALAVMIHGVVKQKRLGGRLAFLIAVGVVTAAVLLFTNSHATYYRFNDWAVSGSSVQDVTARYGEPDIDRYNRVLLQQWMASLPDVDDTVGVENRSCAVRCAGEFRLGKYKVQIGQ